MAFHQKPGAPLKIAVLALLMLLPAWRAIGEVSGNWIYEKITTDTLQKELKSATVRSRNLIQLLPPDAGVNHGLIMIRKVKGGEPEVLFALDEGRFYTGETIPVKIDGGNAEWIAVDKPMDRRTDLLFIHEPIKFINQIKNAKELKIAAQLSQNGEKTFDFTVEGLDLTKVGL